MKAIKQKYLKQKEFLNESKHRANFSDLAKMLGIRITVNWTCVSKRTNAHSCEKIWIAGDTEDLTSTKRNQFTMAFNFRQRHDVNTKGEGDLFDCSTLRMRLNKDFEIEENGKKITWGTVMRRKQNTREELRLIEEKLSEVNFAERAEATEKKKIKDVVKEVDKYEDHCKEESEEAMEKCGFFIKGDGIDEVKEKEATGNFFAFFAQAENKVNQVLANIDKMAEQMKQGLESLDRWKKTFLDLKRLDVNSIEKGKCPCQPCLVHCVDFVEKKKFASSGRKHKSKKSKRKNSSTIPAAFASVPSSNKPSTNKPVFPPTAVNQKKTKKRLADGSPTTATTSTTTSSSSDVDLRKAPPQTDEIVSVVSSSTPAAPRKKIKKKKTNYSDTSATTGEEKNIDEKWKEIVEELGLEAATNNGEKKNTLLQEVDPGQTDPYFPDIIDLEHLFD